MRHSIVVLSVTLLTLVGCTSPRQLSLFSSNVNTMDAPEAPYFNIAPNDALDIRFTALDEEAVSAYGTAGTAFMVDKEGMVNIPVIGQVKLAGKTTEEAKKLLEDMVKNQVKDPIVRLTITNATIAILGEVRKPAKLDIESPIALPQAIGAVGGFTANARLNRVLIQRRENNKIVKYYVNLLTDELFSSPCYYLQKGDVVDVQPLRAQY